MSRAGICLLSASLLLLPACNAGDKAMVDLGNADDYQEFLKEREQAKAPQIFKAEPLNVTATGKVRAQPDIAVITATIKAENKNESQAFNDMSEIVNAVQNALADRNIETGFTRVNSCLLYTSPSPRD